MMFSRLALASAVTALFGVASAQLTITNPGGVNLWWVAQSSNTLAWTCDTSPYSNFTVLLANPDKSILEAPLAILAIEYNYDCSKTITQQQSAQPAGTGYTVQLANPFNSTDVYAESQPFEIKALGASYPTSTPAASSGTSTSTGSTAQTTGKSGAMGMLAPVGMSVAAAMALGLWAA